MDKVLKPEEIDLLKKAISTQQAESLDKINFRSFDMLNMEKISPDLHEKMAIKLINAGRTESVVNYIRLFTGLNFNQDFAKRLIDQGHFDFLGHVLDKFSSLDKETANKLIKNGQQYSVISNLDKFTDLDHKEIINELLKKKVIYPIYENMDKFKGLNKEIALKLIDADVVLPVASNSEVFGGFDREIYLKLFEKGIDWNLNNIIKTIGDIDSEVALALIKGKLSEYVIEKLNIFSGLDRNTALALIGAGWAKEVIKNKDKFNDFVLDKTVAFYIIMAGTPDVIIDNLNMFSGLDNDVAFELIKAGQGLEVMNNLDYFDGIDQLEIAKAMAKNGQKGFVKLNREIFRDLSDKEIESL